MFSLPCRILRTISGARERRERDEVEARQRAEGPVAPRHETQGAQVRARPPARVGARLHGAAQLLGVAQGAGKERDQERDEGPCVSDGSKDLPACATRRLGGHDAAGLGGEYGHELQGDRCRQRDLAGVEPAALEGAQERLQGVRKREGGASCASAAIPRRA